MRLDRGAALSQEQFKHIWDIVKCPYIRGGLYAQIRGSHCTKVLSAVAEETVRVVLKYNIKGISTLQSGFWPSQSLFFPATLSSFRAVSLNNFSFCHCVLLRGRLKGEVHRFGGQGTPPPLN